ncbi:MAG TPA: hypothetical protein VHL80_10155 [Polyangia bacterium]|nr:hypothetical protein [Polyangia bacterium]
MGVSISGPHAGAIHDVVASVLKHHHLEATSTDLPGEAQDAVAAAAKQGKLAAIVVGEVKDGGKRLKLRVYGSGGDLVGEGSWSEAGGLKKLEAVVHRTLWRRVGGALAKARPPGAGAAERPEKAEPPEKDGEAEEEEAAPEAEPAPSDSRKQSEEAAKPDEGEGARKHKKKKAEEPEEEEAATPSGPAATALELAVGPRFLWRKLSWSPSTPNLSAYEVGRAPAIGAFLAWYPAAHFRGGWLSNLGVVTSIEYTPGLSSTRPSDGASFPTKEGDYWGGLRGRLVFGVAQAALTLGGGQHSFIFHSGATPRQSLGELPDVQYTYGRAGLDLRVALPANVSLALGGGYRYVFSAGDSGFLLQQQTYFPSSKVTAFDATAAVGFRFLRLLEVRAGADLRRYAMTAGTNTYNVTSGTDQYIAAWAQVAVLVDGYGAGEGGPAAPAGKAAPPAPKADAGDEEKPGEE